MMYFTKEIPSQGTWIMKQHGGKEYRIAIMRWSDGLNKKVEKAIAEDARRIVACLNFCEDNKTETMERIYKNFNQDPNFSLDNS